MLTKNIGVMTATVDAHAAADLLVQGSYYDNATGKGCFIGCLAHGDNPELIAQQFGIPEPLTRVLECIFEALPVAEARAFFLGIPRAIGTDRKDLARVVWAFLAAELRALPATTPEVQAVVDPVIAGMDLLAAGQEWPQAAWAAEEAAEAACPAVARAARAAAWATAARAEAAWAAAAACGRRCGRRRRRWGGWGKHCKPDNVKAT